jgi:Zn-dependent protease/CBS domain-containing protein
MRWSLTLGRIAGTEIRIHFTFFLFLIWLWFVYYRQGGTPAAWQGVIFVALLFFCVLLHEFGHIFAARRYGVKAPDVTLWPFGGIANLERIPEKPSQELVIAIAGPLVNVAIAAALLLYLGSTTDAMHLMQVEQVNVGLAAKLAGANLFLALFNMIPAFPMDGGRVLRALLALRFGFARATELAAAIGQGFAVVLGIVGIFGNPMLVIIAIFVFLAASGEAGNVQLQQVARGAIVADAMIMKFETLGPQSRVQDAVEALIRTTQREFPVVDGAGHLRGVLTRDAMIRALQANGPDAPVLEAMDSEIPTISARASLETALKTLSGESKPVIGVTDAAGKLVGMLTAENLGEMMMVRSARSARAARGSGASGASGPWGRA